MAHNIDMSNDRYNFAFADSIDRKEIWHGFGTQTTPGASLEDWKRDAGLDWEAFESPVIYQVGLEQKMVSDKKVLYRSDTKESLSVVGTGYKIVQPAEIVDFFDELMTLHGLKMSTMGSLDGGRRFWAMADLGKDFETVRGDKIRGNFFVATSMDGTLSTVAKTTSTRICCANTLTVALGENTKNIIKTSHRSVWDAKQVKIDLGLIDSGWSTFAENMKRLASVKMSDSDVDSYLANRFYDKTKNSDEQTWGAVKTVNGIKALFKAGIGAEYAPNTAYNLLNAVTEFTDHYGVRKVDAGRKFMENSLGKGDDLKSEVYNDMIELMA